jgi:hypothetical protein
MWHNFGHFATWTGCGGSPLATSKVAIISGLVVLSATLAMSNVTQVLSRIESGDHTALGHLLVLVLDELGR